MYKRLTISLVLMGLAAFSIAAAVAYFSDEGHASVTINAGTADLAFAVNDECAQRDYTAIPDSYAVSWENVVPGDEQVDCLRVSNIGTTDLDVYVDHRNDGETLGGVIEIEYAVSSVATSFDVMCESKPVRHEDYNRTDDSNGCYLGTLLAQDGPTVDVFYVRITTTFPDTGEAQNNLQNRTLAFDGFVTGYPASG